MALQAHEYYMARAIRLAANGHYTTRPNPRVGCVLVADSGDIVAEGWHQRAGEGHAEVNALAACTVDTRGLTAFVTLEPCNHTGRTGPCSQALIDADIRRLVYGMQDPNPQVAGAGLARLRTAGVAVEGPVLADECRALNPGFIRRMETGMPWVRVKLGMSLDGRTAMASGESQWITGPQARADVQKLRAQSCAIITGIDTVLHDDAALTLREGELVLPEPQLALALANPPVRVLLDRRGRLPAGSRLLSGGGPVLLVQNQPQQYPDAAVAYEHLSLSDHQSDGDDLRALLHALAARQCNEILVEAGSRLAGSFMAAGLVDELVLYMAPTLLGSSARPLLQLPLEQMAEQQRLTITDLRAFGEDWRITARPLRD